ncbi:hypothetical protein M3Y97_00970900 [Aphelenchoides bicaudatus]|nr:hypothetical protein M3Y97_00970900 [Aphelenchoides bicaudatus]
MKLFLVVSIWLTLLAVLVLADSVSFVIEMNPCILPRCQRYCRSRGEFANGCISRTQCECLFNDDFIVDGAKSDFRDAVSNGRVRYG